VINEKQKHWYVIYTSPNCEKKLLTSIQKINLVGYLPLKEEFRQWSDRRKKITVPLFKSYLFVYLDFHGIHCVKVLPGFVDFIRFGGLPTIIPTTEITLIKTIMAMNNKVETVSKRLCKGEKIKLLKGTLSGHEAILCKEHHRGKVAVEICKLDMSLVLDVPIEDTKKINIL